MKSWKKWLGIVSGLVFSGYFFLFAFKTCKANDFHALLRADLLWAIFWASLLNVLLIPLAGTAWSILLRSMNSHWQPAKLSAMIGFTQIAKYVPGNIAQHVGRTTVALAHGMPAAIFISSVLAESMLLLSASLFIGALSLVLSPGPLPLLDLSLANLLTTSVGIISILTVALVLLFKYVPTLVQHFLQKKDNSPIIIPAPTMSAVAKAFSLYCLSYLVLGASLWIIVSQHGEIPNANLFILTACFTLAWLTGYLAPGAPAGLGVREGALVLLLSGAGLAEHVLTVVIAARFATILADAISFVISASLMKAINKETSPQYIKKINENTTPALFVGGLHMGGSGYPNAYQTLQILRDRLLLQIEECGAWLPDSMHLWRLGKAPLPAKIVALSWFLLGNLVSVLKVTSRQDKEKKPTYLPYPSIFFLWWASWIPVCWRPRCIADAYISVWDAMYRDRSQNGSSSFVAKTLKSFEARALRTAELVLVDTVANKDMLTHEFGLKEHSVKALPLAIDEESFLEPFPPATKQNASITVLFVGTLIPLHGIATILETVRLLIADPLFRFRFLGDGQEAYLIENFVAELDTERFTWIREWLDPLRIADEIRQADICLGIFGGEGKAQRVLPFKIYMYLASGKAIVSQASFSLPESTPQPPMLSPMTNNAQDVANAIARLAIDEKLRHTLEADARAYYMQHLGHERIALAWCELLVRFSTEQHITA